MRLWWVSALGLGSGLAWGNTLPNRVLFVGNSYTAFNGPDSLEVSVRKLIEERAEGPDLVVAKYTVGGATLPMHLESAQSGALKTVMEEGWDLVVLQDQSQVPGFPETNLDWQASRDAAVALAEMAAGVGAETRLFLTWGRENGDPQNASLYPDYSTMQDRLSEGYNAYAQAIADAGLSVQVVEVGEVWRSIHDALLASDLSPAEGDTLFTRLYLNDGSHPSPHGTYLAATSFYAALTGDSPVGLEWSHEGISEEDRAAIQTAAEALLPPEPVDSDAEETAAPQGDTDVTEQEKSSCGCESGPTGRTTAWGLALGLAILFRRRPRSKTAYSR